MNVDDATTRGQDMMGPRMSVNLSVQRQTPDTGFGKRVQAGLQAASDAVGTGLGAVAALTPGGYAISAAVSSLGTTPGGVSSGPYGQVVAAISPSSPMSTTVNPGGPAAQAQGNVTLAAAQAGHQALSEEQLTQRAHTLLDSTPRAEALLAASTLAQTNAAVPSTVAQTGAAAAPLTLSQANASAPLPAPAFTTSGAGTPTLVVGDGTGGTGIPVPSLGGMGAAVPGIGSAGGIGTPNYSSLLQQSAQAEMQALLFQQQMSQETIVFSALSNVIHSRHEASYNSIKNIS